MSNSIAFQTVSSDQLTSVSGGFGLGWLKPVAKFAGKKVLGPASAAISGYQGMNKFLDDRDHHKSFGRSVWDGVKAAVI
ncbi:MAG TPA: hypothetical protein VHW23_24140 [Kofleriaceae bacterium]|jgi:hypothetical protein|nr:hypothetical protein [Kofleriaceae bacterium]